MNKVNEWMVKWNPKSPRKVEYDNCDWLITDFNFQSFAPNEHKELKNKIVGISVNHTKYYEFTFATLPFSHIVVECSK